MKYIIDGSFLVENTVGVQRYALEITKEIDNLLEQQPKKDLEIEILIPNASAHSYGYRNIREVYLGTGAGKKWQQLTFYNYVRKATDKNGKQALPICLCNHYPIFATGGVVCIHDICFKTNPEFFQNKGDRREILFRRLMYRQACKHADHIITVSEFSKQQIMAHYSVKEDILVAGNGWQHYDMNDIDETIFELKHIEKDNYYFFMSSLAPNKNLKWIVENAQHFPNNHYVLSGNMLGDSSGIEQLPNVKLVGFVSDAQARALMKYCKAFLFPSTYEGFGIPPMEALVMGANVIVGDIPVLREIYKDSVHYIPTDNANINLEELQKQPVADAHDILNLHSWQISAQKIYNLL